jgi:hypothetical protein
VAKSRKNIASEKKAVSTIYASLVALLIVFLLLSLLASYFYNYNETLQNQMNTNEQKTEEALLIADANVSQNVITDIKVQNTGTTAIKIRAIYSKNSTATSFVSDPLVYISPGDTYEIPTNIGYNSTESLFVATERGTLSKEYFVHKWETSGFIYDTENLEIGYVKLRFESFYYSVSNGNNWGPWELGWNPPRNQYIRWKINVTNISNYVIKLNNSTALNLWAPGSPETAWYINATQINLTIGEQREIIFPIDNSGNLQKYTSSSSSAMVFLTFLGKVVLSDGSEMSYGQTIPFEAVVIGA